jgi:hypothetical protein
MPKIFVWALVLLATQLVARAAQACKSDTDCKGDRVCESGRCVSPKVGPTACHQDKDCAGNDVCEQNVCIGPNGVAPGAAPAAPMTVATTSAPVVAAPAQAPGPAAAAMPPPEATPYPGAPAAAAPVTAPATESPAATTTSTAPKGPATGPATPPLPSVFKSIGILKPDAEGMWGLSGHMDYRIDSWSSNDWAMTCGVAYEGMGYLGDADIKIFTNAAGMTLGIHPAQPKTLSFALRGGAILLVTQTEYAGQKNNDFSAAFLAGGDLNLGYLMFGVEAWMRNGSSWMMRGGFAW